MVQVGDFELYSVITGRFGLDGGAMFGVVPKILWEKVTQPDDHNRIPLVTRTLIAIHKAESRVILVDTGCGTKWTPDQAQRFAIEHDATAIDRALGSLGYARSDVTDVVVTHLHFDHNGGLSDWKNEIGGPTVLRYPQARHWIHSGHWEHAKRPHIKDRASFLGQDFAALEGDDCLTFVDGEQTSGPIPGWNWLVTHGHTPFQLHPVFRGDDVTVIWTGDMIPTHHHIRPAWVMAYDMQPSRTIDEKTALSGRIRTENTLIAFPHDPIWSGARLSGTDTKPEAQESDELELRI